MIGGRIGRGGRKQERSAHPLLPQGLIGSLVRSTRCNARLAVYHHLDYQCQTRCGDA